MAKNDLSRRQFMRAAGALGIGAVVVPRSSAGAAAASDNPLVRYGLAWTDQIRWKNVAVVEGAGTGFADERFAAAQQAVVARGGGVVYFPPGVYRFKDHLRLEDGVVIRGADPAGETEARSEKHDLPTRFEFPKYVPSFEGDGTPIETAFKGILLADPAKASNCGIANVAINRGHIDFKEAEGYESGVNRFVVGCVLRNAAVADPAVPDKKTGQHGWQRFTQRHRAAVTVRAQKNILVANNRLPESGDDNFTMDGYVLKGGVEDGLVFDYDNRPGLYINDYGLGGAGGNGPDGTPETHPQGFRKGIVIRDNYIFCTGRCAISFTGDGTICANNVIRFKDNVWRPTTTGTNRTRGSATNDNRAVQMRGWRWTVEGNDYRVYRNLTADRDYRINDGEGLMHEDHVNSTVRDSRVLNNKGNSYISIYKTAGIDGLLVKGNNIRTGGGIAAIYVVANRNSGPYQCRNVTIEDNTTAGSGIYIAGDPATNNVIRNNKHVGGGGTIKNEARAKLENNEGYEIVGG